jgi:hypothetical protein
MSRRDQPSRNLPEHLIAGSVSQTTERNWLDGFFRDQLISAERDGYIHAASPPTTAVCRTYVYTTGQQSPLQFVVR